MFAHSLFVLVMCVASVCPCDVWPGWRPQDLSERAVAADLVVIAEFKNPITHVSEGYLQESIEVPMTPNCILSNKQKYELTENMSVWTEEPASDCVDNMGAINKALGHQIIVFITKDNFTGKWMFQNVNVQYAVAKATGANIHDLTQRCELRSHVQVTKSPGSKGCPAFLLSSSKACKGDNDVEVNLTGLDIVRVKQNTSSTMPASVIRPSDKNSTVPSGYGACSMPNGWRPEALVQRALKADLVVLFRMENVILHLHEGFIQVEAEISVSIRCILGNPKNVNVPATLSIWASSPSVGCADNMAVLKDGQKKDFIAFLVLSKFDNNKWNFDNINSQLAVFEASDENLNELGKQCEFRNQKTPFGSHPRDVLGCPTQLIQPIMDCGTLYVPETPHTDSGFTYSYFQALYDWMTQLNNILTNINSHTE